MHPPKDMAWRKGIDEKPWSERIPAMIAKGREHVLSAAHRSNAIAIHGAKCKWGITAGEVALAVLGWEMWVEYCKSLENEEPGDEPPAELRAYTEKVERIEP